MWSGQRSFTKRETYIGLVKENHHLAKERVTCYTQITSDNDVVIPPEFLFIFVEITIWP